MVETIIENLTSPAARSPYPITNDPTHTSGFTIVMATIISKHSAADSDSIPASHVTGFVIARTKRQEHKIPTHAIPVSYTHLSREQEAQGVRAFGEAEAAAIKAKGLAEAESIQAKGLAEAEAMEKKAEAYAKYNKAAVAEMMIKVLPDIAGKIAEPLSQIDKITIIGGNGDANGVEQVAGNVPAVMAKLFESMKETTGIDLSSIINAESYDAKVNRNITVNGLDGVSLTVAQKPENEDLSEKE